MEMFSFEQKVATIKVLMDIALSDDNLDPHEVAYTGQLMQTFNFASSEEVVNFVREEAADLKAEDAMHTMSQMSPLQKTLVAQMMAEMVFADGEAHDNERDIMRAVLFAMFSA